MCMYVFVSMCVCILYMCIFIYVGMYLCMYEYVCIYIWFVHVCMNICVFVCVCVNGWIYGCTLHYHCYIITPHTTRPPPYYIIPYTTFVYYTIPNLILIPISYIDTHSTAIQYTILYYALHYYDIHLCYTLHYDIVPYATLPIPY